MATFSAVCSLDTERKGYLLHQRASNRKVLVGLVVSVIAHVVFVMFFGVPSSRSGVERAPAKSIQLKLVNRVDRSREVADSVESHDRITESQRKQQKPGNELPANPVSVPSVVSPTERTQEPDEPTAEAPTRNIVNQLQRYRWFDEAPSIDLRGETKVDGLPLQRVWGAPLGKEIPIALPFDRPLMDLVDDQTPCEKMNERALADLELAPDPTLPDYREIGAAGLSVLKVMTIIGCGVRSINR